MIEKGYIGQLPWCVPPGKKGLDRAVPEWDGQYWIKVTQELPPPPSSTHSCALTPELFSPCPLASYSAKSLLVGEHFSSVRAGIRKMFWNGMLFSRMITWPKAVQKWRKRMWGESAQLEAKGCALIPVVLIKLQLLPLLTNSCAPSTAVLTIANYWASATPFYRWGSWGSKMVAALATLLMRTRDRTLTQAWKLPKLNPGIATTIGSWLWDGNEIINTDIAMGVLIHVLNLGAILDSSLPLTPKSSPSENPADCIP